jgi:hypothetical protein
MKLVYFAFKHRYRYKDLNNFLFSRTYGKYFLLNLGGPLKHFLAKILIKFKIGIPISLDGRPLLKDDFTSINFFIRGTNLNVPSNIKHLKNNTVSIKHPILENKNIFQVYPINLKKVRVKDDFKLVYMSTINIDTTQDEKLFWEKSKKKILSDFTTIDKADFWKDHFSNSEAKVINQYYRKAKLLLRYDIILYLKEKFKEKFILIGSDWAKLSVESRESNYSINQNKETYRGNICLDLGCIEGSSSLYSRSNQIIESGGLIVQSNQLDYANKWNNLSEKILFKNFEDLDFVLEKIFNDYEHANNLLKEIYKNFLYTDKLIENSLDKVLSNK